MRVLSTRELVDALVCPACRTGALRATASDIACTSCARHFAIEDGVASFNLAEELSTTNRNEIAANAITDDHKAQAMLAKEEWHPILTDQMKWVIEVVDRMLPDRDSLYALGVGTGFELQLLLRRRAFARVFASDISPSAIALVARALAEYPGELGLFASEFGRCPVPKRAATCGLVFQALHHANDAHGALEKLLDHNFDDLVLVEPVTHRVLRVLARFELVQRVEYSGTRPDWLDLTRVTALAASRGYAVRSQTWWEVPPYFFHPLATRPRMSRAVARVFDGVSRATNTIRFGSMAAIHLTRA